MGERTLNADPWPPSDLDSDLAQIGRIILNFNALEKHSSGVLRQFIIDDFADRTILGLCESLTGVELENNLLRFAHVLEADGTAQGCENAIRHLIKVYKNGKSLRNRIVHELANSLIGGKLHLHKHTFGPSHEGKGLLVDKQLLDAIVDWLRMSSTYAAEIGIELSFIRGLRSESERQYIPRQKSGWPDPIPLLPWEKLEVRSKNER